MSPRMVRVCRFACAASVAVCASCASPRSDPLQEANAAETRAHLAEAAQSEELRQRMRGVAQEIAIHLPLACDAALLQVSDFETTSELLALAGDCGMFAFSRCGAVDPRRGLADLIVTFSTVKLLFERYAADPNFQSLRLVVDALDSSLADLDELAREWLSEEVRRSMETDIAAAVRSETTVIRGSVRSLGLMHAQVNVPSALQIQSSFLSFNDNGLLEHALGEAHYMRLGVQRTADCMSLLPQAMEYHGRRAALWTMLNPQVRELSRKLDAANTELSSLKQLESLSALAPLDELKGLPWKIGGALVLALAVQGVLLALVMRRR
ncbi:MAG: hypothetical protein JNK53_01550 [Phycisphaerae bacterium]|nr:hypothetical protein [Phycisphaerae bacterium]